MLCVCQPSNMNLLLTTPRRHISSIIPRWIIDVKCLSQGHNVALPFLGTKPIVDNLAVANMRSCIQKFLENR